MFFVLVSGCLSWILAIIEKWRNSKAFVIESNASIMLFAKHYICQQLLNLV